MTGILNVILASSGLRYSVTIGNSGSLYGFVSSSFGAISPSGFRGVAIVNVHDQTGSDDFQVALEGSRAQSFFTGIEIQSTAGALVTFFTSQVSTYSDIGTTTFWTWDTSGDIWTSTSPSPRLIRIF